MKKKTKSTYISDQLEDQPWSKSVGQVQVLQANKKEKIKDKIKRKLK